MGLFAYNPQEGKTMLVTYLVTGVGEFPHDMLRYDRAEPRTATDRLKIATLTRSLNDPITVFDSAGPQTVRLQSSYHPASDRWASFGWTVSWLVFRYSGK